jgi:hypothetical protein
MDGVRLVLGGADPSDQAQAAEQGFRGFLKTCALSYLDYPGPTWDGIGIHRWLSEQNVTEPVQIIAFSAGVVGAAVLCRLRSGQVSHCLAVDGWCVPLPQSCKQDDLKAPHLKPSQVGRLSHDWVTHANGILMGGDQFFYADPHVSHLALWQDPAAVKGWMLDQAQQTGFQRTTAAAFIQFFLAG